MNDTNHRAQFDVSQITESIYLGADMCCGGDHYDYVCDELGVSVDIAVLEERLETPSAKLHMFLWLPMADNSSPSQEQFEAGVAVITAAVNAQRKVFVHCRLGHGRSPTLLAAYFVSLGQGVDEALAFLESKRPEIHPNAQQITALRLYSTGRASS